MHLGCSFISLTVNNRTLAEVSDEKIHIQGSTGKDELQRRHLLQQVPHFGQKEIRQAIPLVDLVLRKERLMSCVFFFCYLNKPPNTNAIPIK